MDRLKDKLDSLSNYYDELIDDLPEKDEFIKNRLSRRGIEKTIELICETIIDISNIIISKNKLEKPTDSRSSITILEKNNMISKKLSEKIKDLISFRNLLVHRYGKIDEIEEFENIVENHEDILKFIKEISSNLK